MTVKAFIQNLQMADPESELCIMPMKGENLRMGTTIMMLDGTELDVCKIESHPAYDELGNVTILNLCLKDKEQAKQAFTMFEEMYELI